MKYIFDIKTFRKFESILTHISVNVQKIYAAIAFNQSELLLDYCIKNKISLEWWGLFNSKGSTNYDLVKKAIISEFVKFYPFAEYFHPKIIYFEGYGLYIGSANMTKSALYKNIEAGIFIEENEIDNKKEILSFFDTLRNESIVATNDDLEQLEIFLSSTITERDEIDKLNSHIEDNFKENLGHLFLLKAGVTDYGKENTSKASKKKLYFMQEWRETQNCLQIVKELISKNCKQPSWINKNANLTIITDQLLHAYYYSFVLKQKSEDEEFHKSIVIVNENYEKNRFNTTNAVLKAIEWWQDLNKAPSDEDIHINNWGITNYNILQNLKNRDLTLDEFTTVMLQNHAAKNHARQIKNDFFNLPKDFKTTMDERTKIYSEWIYKQTSKNGINIQDLMRYILFNEDTILEARIYNAIFDEKYHIDRFGKSIIGELVGWGRPDISLLRNNRVNKALKCLGYNVRLFSD